MTQTVLLKSHAFSSKFITGVMALGVIAVLLTTSSLNFNIAGVVPNLSAEAILAGLLLAFRAYKAGADIRRALQIAFAWNIVSIIIWVAGDLLIWLLENNVEYLAKL
ncbi:hypothetical protein ACFFK0_13830 [Paenibacillus chartarius]|uniref:Uncharacterized protein n=1 Tax=Paenibacillus chartarius TaxID=747481 RepID=A0ABV6DLP3_9BACL